MPESPYFPARPVSRTKQARTYALGVTGGGMGKGMTRERASAEAAAEGTDLHLGIRAVNRKLLAISYSRFYFYFRLCVCVCARARARVCVSLRAANGLPSR